MAPHAHQTPPIGRRTREDGRPRSRPTSRPSSSRRDSHGSSIPRPQQAHYYPSPMRRAASSPARPRHKSPSTFGFGKATRRDPSPADSERSERSERGARPSASARGDTSSGSGKVRRAGATAVGDAGFRQSNVKVALRCRPLSGKERRAGEVAVVGVHEQTVTILTGGEADDTHVFAFDYAFGPEADQVSLFAACGAPLVEQASEGPWPGTPCPCTALLHHHAAAAAASSAPPPPRSAPPPSCGAALRRLQRHLLRLRPDWVRRDSRWKGPSTLPDDSAPSARLVPPGAQAAPSQPRAPPQHLGGVPWRQEPAFGRPKKEGVPVSRTRQDVHHDGLRRRARPHAPRLLVPL